ncbi:hypothetical protein N8I77_009173 [Diaporthe amygdali]|uniref:Uncharacterized protein n=1 Tax=Phomopsis amygdali TaxID=1214568 RepID=A0AAD9W268_PHOAM|nr:hypothetical protein N8I77_009173 [Diaporthe amygdali]
MASIRTMNQGDGRPRKTGGPWSVAENERLKMLVDRCANKTQVHWVEIAREHGTRDAKQCRERWDNHLKPGLKRDKILDPEGAVLLQWVREHGKHWAPLGRAMQRPENMVKNYYYQEFKKTERGVRPKKREMRHHASQRQDSVPMSRGNSSSSSYQPFGRSSMSPMYAPAAHDYGNNHQAPYYPSGQHHANYQYPSRRTSIASIITNPPSLASDHGSPAESPRAAAEIPYPQGQFALPPFQRGVSGPKLLSPQEMLEATGHKRSNSASSYGSLMALPHSPISLPIRTGFSTPAYGDSAQRNRDRHAPVFSPSANSGFFDNRFDRRSPPRNAEPSPSNSRSGSDTRMSISSLLG